MWNLLKRPSQETRIANFWQWFTKNESNLRGLVSDMKTIEKALNQVSKELDKIGPLALEFGEFDSEKPVFVISADGIKKTIPLVAAVCKAAPALQKFQLVAFRQRKEDTEAVLQSFGLSITTDDCAFSADHGEEGLIDIVLYMNGMSEENYQAYVTAGFLLLDNTLGEFEVATGIGGIEFEALTDEVKAEIKIHPIVDLRKVFDSMQQSVSGSVVGNWSGEYWYEASEQGADRQFPFTANLTAQGGYLEGTMNDKSELGEAKLFGLVKGAVMIFEKTYKRTDADPVLYYGRLESNGKSVAGKWQLEVKGQMLDGRWGMEKQRSGN